MVALTRILLLGQQEKTDMDRSFFKTWEFLTKASPSVRVPRAETRLTVYRSPLVSMLPQLVVFFPVERACVKLDVCLQDLVMFRIQMCLWICIFQILIILRLRSELVNDRNDKTGFFSFPRTFSKSGKMTTQNLKFHTTVWKTVKFWPKQILLYVSPERKPGWRFTARPSWGCCLS